jgi:hypothetical protein
VILLVLNDKQTTTMWTDYYFSPQHDDSFYPSFLSPWQVQYEQEAQRRLRRHREMEYRREMLRRAQEEQRLLELQNQQKQPNRHRQNTKHVKSVDAMLHQPSHSIFQGLDGRWYRVPIRQNHRSKESHDRTGPHRRWYQSESDTDDDQNSEVFHDVSSGSTRDETKPTEISTRRKEENQQPTIATKKSSLDKSQTQTNKNTNGRKSKEIDNKSRGEVVIVEDASDSEQEDVILDSVWRNRRPSPGQWMEPVPME